MASRSRIGDILRNGASNEDLSELSPALKADPSTICSNSGIYRRSLIHAPFLDIL
jgi:hypothetical protein